MDHWSTLAALPLEIEACEYGRLDPGEGFGEAHATRLVRLGGAGCEGRGEDITLFLGDDAPELALAGEWTLGSFCTHLASLEQFPDGEPEFAEFARRWRNWAYESAALDLALRQAGRSLHDVLGREPRPVRFVNSFGRDETGDVVVGKVQRRLERYPELRFKLDATTSWTDEVVAALAATGAVDIIDFKGRYGLEIEDPGALPDLYERVLAAFPDALVEDAHELPEITALVAPHAARVSWDAPIHAVADLDAQPIVARTINIKPSRVGRLEDLFALYAECERRGLAIYGGGMGELGVARGQIQLLAAIFSPDGPNDIAPPGFNALEPVAGLPASPLDPDPAPIGFRRRADD